MKCIYCHNIVDVNNINGSGDCKICNVGYHVDRNDEIIYVNIVVSKYSLLFHIITSKCYVIDDFGNKTICVLNYLPLVTPATSMEWINKVLNLKAFL